MLVSTKPAVKSVHGLKRHDPGTRVRYGLYSQARCQCSQLYMSVNKTVNAINPRVVGGIEEMAVESERMAMVGSRPRLLSSFWSYVTKV